MVKKYFKAKVYEENEKQDTNRSVNLQPSEITGCGFIRVKVSEQNYFGEDVFIVIISDVSKKFTSKILQKQTLE